MPVKMSRILKLNKILLISIFLSCSLNLSIAGDQAKHEKPVSSETKKKIRPKCPKDMVHIHRGLISCKKDQDAKGTTLIFLEEFCIDRYEFPNKKGEIPSTKITWFEAEVYCKKLEKRLCKGEEWEKACAGKNLLKYSYGDIYQPEKCGQSEKTRRDVDRSGSHPGCVSQYGVHDMIGGVWEWTDDPKNRTYIKRGGYVNANLDEANCFTRTPQAPKQAGMHDGFRCCKDIPVQLKD